MMTRRRVKLKNTYIVQSPLSSHHNSQQKNEIHMEKKRIRDTLHSTRTGTDCEHYSTYIKVICGVTFFRQLI